MELIIFLSIVGLVGLGIIVWSIFDNRDIKHQE